MLAKFPQLIPTKRGNKSDSPFNDIFFFQNTTKSWGCVNLSFRPTTGGNQFFLYIYIKLAVQCESNRKHGFGFTPSLNGKRDIYN